jgi:molybdate transport system substrate-binding protein
MTSCGSAPREVHVSAAISLRAPLEALARRYEAAHPGARVRLSFGASGDLAAQIARGAPVSLFVSAAPELIARVRASARAEVLCDVAANALVLVRRPDPALADLTWENLAAHSAVARLALGASPAVPAGVYAERALTALGALEPLRRKLVRGGNVRHVLELVARGEADAAVVYATDVRGRGDVVVVGAPPARARADVRYPLAWLAAGPQPALARHFGAWLCGAEGRGVFVAHGFAPP